MPMNRTAMFFVLVLLLPDVHAGGQWLQHPTAGLPRTADGKPDLSSPARRTAEGRTDLTGIWGAEFVQGFPKYLLDIAVDLGPEGVPFQEWARSLYRERMEWNSKDDPIARCQPAGIPRLIGFPAPFKIVHLPNLIVVLYEQDTTYRQIFLDGRALPPEISQPSWMGYSVGRWEGDVLVVESIGFNSTSWFDVYGHPHTEALRLIERYRRVNVGQLEIQITIDDPKAYTRPWTVTQRRSLLTDTELLELFCTENEKVTSSRGRKVIPAARLEIAMAKHFTALVAVAILGGSPPLLAHHSFAATFDATKPLKLTGTVTSIEWANPHVYFYIDVVDEQSGAVDNWAIELPSPNVLARNGWSRNSMTIGDEVVVEGSPARDRSRLGSARSVALSATGRRLFDISGGADNSVIQRAANSHQP